MIVEAAFTWTLWAGSEFCLSAGHTGFTVFRGMIDVAILVVLHLKYYAFMRGSLGNRIHKRIN